MAYRLIAPGSKLDFTHDWSSWLAPEDQITSRQWTVTPTHGSPETPTLEDATNARVFISECRAGLIYSLTETVQTAGNLTAQRSITLRCERQ